MIPVDWHGFKATRVFRGVAYNIAVKRAGAGNAVTLVVDGVPVAGEVVPLPAAGIEVVTVEVTLA